MELIRCPETSAKDHHSMLRNIPEEHSSQGYAPLSNLHHVCCLHLANVMSSLLGCDAVFLTELFQTIQDCFTLMEEVL
jgi:hypothetical protein